MLQAQPMALPVTREERTTVVVAGAVPTMDGLDWIRGAGAAAARRSRTPVSVLSPGPGSGHASGGTTIHDSWEEIGVGSS